MAQATRPNKSSKSRRDESDKESAEAPSLSDRATSGMRLADHVRKAAEGGKLRKGFSLWRASKELPVVAAGAGEVFKRHPIPLSIAGGALVTAGLLVLASSMGAFDTDSAEASDESEGKDASADERDAGDEEAADEDQGEDE